MRIVHIAAEFAPIAKAGGLGEVIVGLCRELNRSGHSVDVIIPKYGFISLNKNTKQSQFKCLANTHTMWSTEIEGCRLHLLEADCFNRGEIYGYEDDLPRFIYFSRAALDYLQLQNKPIDALHLHDWHAALCAPLIKDIFKDLPVRKVILSLHNIEYQGKCAAADLDAVGMKGETYLVKEKLQDDNPKFPKTVNLLKGGIVYADAIVPVSPSYAKEILTPEHGFNLDRTLRGVQGKIFGILNGIDTTLWNPAQDRALIVNYTVASALKGKELNRGHFHLDQRKRPWVGAVTRLVPQKGPELLEAALEKTVEMGGSFLLLGSSPIPKIQDHFNRLKERYRAHPQVFLQCSYDEALAHLIYASLDLLIVPSRFEPCGLTQLIAMRYGTIPVVRATGGLKDTVFEGQNGFSFSDATIPSMSGALERACRVFRSDPEAFQGLMQRGMNGDLGWRKPAQEYVKLYGWTR